MLKTTLLAAFAVTAVSAFGQSDQMMSIDAKSATSHDLIAYVAKDASKKLNAGDAYTLTTFVGGLPLNYQLAVLRGLAMNAEEAREEKTRNQTSANSMAPMGDRMPDMMESAMKAPKSYWQTIEGLQKGQDSTDQGLIATLFRPRLFIQDPLMTPENEKALDAITKYFAANAWSTEPTRLKYTSLAPHSYTSPVIPR